MKNALSSGGIGCQVLASLLMKVSQLSRFTWKLRPTAGDYRLMRFFPVILFLAANCILQAAPASTEPSPPAATTPAAPVPLPAPEIVFQARLENFDVLSYAREVELLIGKFEETSGRRLIPGAKRKVGLKIYTDSGPGMATPVPLVKAVIAALERRGFTDENIFLVGLNALRLRMTGYLPSLVTGQTPFQGHPVYVLESGKFYDPVWFYDSPLPQRFDPVFAEQQTKDVSNTSTKDEDRKSFLATPLFLETDFWINLPVYTDHVTLGVNGALVNATLWNASNTARFFRSPANAPAAVAEMSAIPELRQTWIFTLTSLEHYQFIGGPFFNSLYTVSEPLLWLSADPVMLDALMRDRIDRHRKMEGFEPLSDEIRTLEFAETLGVGSTNIKTVKIVSVGP